MGHHKKLPLTVTQKSGINSGVNYAEVEKVTTENFKHQFNMKCIPDSCSGLCSVDWVVLFVAIEKIYDTVK